MCSNRSEIRKSGAENDAGISEIPEARSKDLNVKKV